ncbi:hypothetical protein [Dysgonomonas sp. Marseille-P4361]|uniref:hypothetical protein n=1 Tax=Dysgonomonas sp. Marseille-P4361 TaxID=2161820 RepID=UPI000D54BF4C|nr:hypothetical protein [Dysgonomonas sp. Marseille-P4361]
MKLLKDFNRHSRYIEFTSKEQYFDSSRLSPIIGWFCKFENNFSALYIENDILYFLFNNNKAHISPNIKVELSQPLLIDTSSPLKLYQREFNMYERKSLFRKKLLFSFRYIVEEFYQLTMENEEDFDWGLFVANIVNNHKRQKTIIELLNKKKD